MHRIAITYQPFVPRAVAFLAVVCAVCALMYSVFLLEAVAHAAARDDAQNQIQQISEQTSALEEQYLSMSQALTPEKAAALGYVAPQDVATVFMQQSASVLTLAGKYPVQ